MNYGLIIKLSLFGLAMGLATVFFIPSNIEPAFWLVVFIISAYIIAKQCNEKYFLYGLLTSLGNCVWVTSAHILLYGQYAANHPEEVAMMNNAGFMSDQPRLFMLLTGPVIGLVSGVVLGLFCWIASKLVKKTTLA